MTALVRSFSLKKNWNGLMTKKKDFTVDIPIVRHSFPTPATVRVKDEVNSKIISAK